MQDTHSFEKFPSLYSCTIAVIGLGYVGLPLAVEFGKEQNAVDGKSKLIHRVIGFDTSSSRINELGNGFDRTCEITEDELKSCDNLVFTDDRDMLAQADVFIVTVPTPIDNNKRPNLDPLRQASISVGRALKVRSSLIRSKGESWTCPIVIYESTVFPGATDEVCIPLLSKHGELPLITTTNKIGFGVGYSPERINPGDKKHRLRSIVKVTSGCTKEAAEWVDAFYSSIIDAGTYMAAGIKVAEASKVIENTQRDLNIALVNELAVIFRRLKIDTLDVLDAAGSKWNFLNFKPGLVGGHCISVDPYYLTSKAEESGYYPHILLAGRRINDGMGSWIAEQLVLEMAKCGMSIAGTEVLILGLTFKENCPDLRNTKVLDIIKTLTYYGMRTIVVDPCVDKDEAEQIFNIKTYKKPPSGRVFKVIIAAVAHLDFVNWSFEDWSHLLEGDGILFDIKGIAPRSLKPIRL